MKPNFKDINIKASEKASMSAAEWEKANHIAKNWTTPELIPVKPVYTADDLKGMELLLNILQHTEIAKEHGKN